MKALPRAASGRSAAGLLGLPHEGPGRWPGLSCLVRWSPEALWVQPEGDAPRLLLLPGEAQGTSRRAMGMVQRGLREATSSVTASWVCSPVPGHVKATSCAPGPAKGTDVSGHPRYLQARRARGHPENPDSRASCQATCLKKKNLLRNHNCKAKTSRITCNFTILYKVL